MNSISPTFIKQMAYQHDQSHIDYNDIFNVNVILPVLNTYSSNISTLVSL